MSGSSKSTYPHTAPQMWCASCRLYQIYWQRGVEQDRSGLFPRVLFVAPSQRRASLIERSMRSARNLNLDLFALTTSDDALKWLTGEAS